jgi:hypothetical protein
MSFSLYNNGIVGLGRSVYVSVRIRICHKVSHSVGVRQKKNCLSLASETVCSTKRVCSVAKRSIDTRCLVQFRYTR